MNQSFVGATNVGSMTLDHDPELITNTFNFPSQKISSKDLNDVKVKKGEQMGMFKLGSTVVQIFEAPSNFKFNIKEGDSIKYGQIFGEFKMD